jgi:ATP-dependent DNA ligase
MYLATLPKAVRFDHIKGIDDSRTKEQRYESLQAIWDNSRIIDDLNDIAVLVKQTQYTSIDEVFHDQAIISGYEGLVMMHKNSSYKMGRHSLNSGMAYKIKEDNLQFDGVILSLEEGTEVIEEVDKKINELGRSVTSKLKEHRTQVDYAKASKFLWTMVTNLPFL